MAPKRKRRRLKITDSGLGASLKEKDTELTGEDGVVDSGKQGGNDEAGGENRQSVHPESKSPANESESPKEVHYVLEENRSPESMSGFPDKPSDASGNIVPVECVTEAVSNCGSELTTEGLLQIMNVRSVQLDALNNSQYSICNTCTEKCDGHNISIESADTEIFVRESVVPENCKVSHVSTTDESCNLSRICPSQNTGESVAVCDTRQMEGTVGLKDSSCRQIEGTAGRKDSNRVRADDMLAMMTLSCPAEIDRHTEVTSSTNWKLTNNLRGQLNFQHQTPLHHRVHFNRELPQKQRFPEHVEMLNREGENREREALTQPSAPSLSVWSEAQSEYLPSGQPSDLGELLEVATRYVVKVWVKEIDPSISGPPTNLVIKFCSKCHIKYRYDEDDHLHTCSNHGAGGSKKPLKLMFYVELEIYDETNETMRVALTGNQAAKLFGCLPEEFIKNASYQKKVWSSFKRLIKGGNTQNWCLKDAVNISLEPHLKGKKMNYRVLDIRPF